MAPKFQIFFLLGISILFLGMSARGSLKKGELKAEIRLKLYNEAIGHYEKAKTAYQEGKLEESLRQLQRATKVIQVFPEAYDLSRKIYLELGKPSEAKEQEKFLLHFKEDQKASLYQLREEALQEIAWREKSAPPPDVRLFPALFISGGSAGIFIFGMIYEYRRLRGGGQNELKRNRIILEPFPEDEEREAATSWFFKLCALLLPAPLLFLLLVVLGFRTYSDLLPIFFFTWSVVDLAVYLIFFADLSGLGGLRRPGGAS